MNVPNIRTYAVTSNQYKESAHAGYGEVLASEAAFILFYIHLYILYNKAHGRLSDFVLEAEFSDSKISAVGTFHFPLSLVTKCDIWHAPWPHL